MVVVGHYPEIRHRSGNSMTNGHLGGTLYGRKSRGQVLQCHTAGYATERGGAAEKGTRTVVERTDSGGRDAAGGEPTLGRAGSNNGRPSVRRRRRFGLSFVHSIFSDHITQLHVRTF